MNNLLEVKVRYAKAVQYELTLELMMKQRLRKLIR